MTNYTYLFIHFIKLRMFKIEIVFGGYNSILKTFGSLYSHYLHFRNILNWVVLYLVTQFIKIKFIFKTID